MKRARGNGGGTGTAVVLGLALAVTAGVLLLRWRPVDADEVFSACAVEGDFPWPVDVAEPVPLGKTYMQLQSQGVGPHIGVDVLAPAGSPVRAAEGGRIVAVSGDWAGGTYSLIVASSVSPHKGLRYVHLASRSLPFGLGDFVRAGEVLGRIAGFTIEELVACPADAPGCYDHLHLESVRAQGVTAARWSDGEAHRNPLAYLGPTGDDEPPRFELLPVSAYASGCAPAVRLLALLDSDQPWVELCPAQLEAGTKVDVVAGVVDLPGTGSPWENVPYCTRLTIRPVGLAPEPTVAHTAEFTLRFDGEPAAASGLDSVYVEVGDLMSHGPTAPQEDRRFYLVLTNQGFTDGWWTPVAIEGAETEYRLRAEVFDPAGNRRTATTTVTVQPSTN